MSTRLSGRFSSRLSRPPRNTAMQPRMTPARVGGASRRLNPTRQEHQDLAHALSKVPEGHVESPEQQADRERFGRLNAAFAARENYGGGEAPRGNTSVPGPYSPLLYRNPPGSLNEVYQPLKQTGPVGTPDLT